MKQYYCESVLFACTFILNCFGVDYDIFSTFNISAFWNCMRSAFLICMRKISSKYIKVGSCFDVFVEGNSMVQSDFNFDSSL